MEQLREKIPVNCPTRLYPFTIKKGCNVYGIIFGASHPRGVEKFLQTAWTENNINGEANFDIDDDRNKGQADLFGYVELTKIMKFRQEIRQAILDGKIETNRGAFDFALNQGHLPSHAADEIKLMKEAVEDHRASSKNPPRSIYGKIVAEADRDINPLKIIKRTIKTNSFI